MKVKVIKSEYLSELQRPSRIKQDLEKYRSGKPLVLPEEFIADTKVVIDDLPKLNPSDVAAITCENAIKLHKSLKNMNRTSASDQRLWAWLACEPFAEYMAKRWASKKPWTSKGDDDAKTKNVLAHWYLQGQASKYYYNHGLAYLWWGVEMTKGLDTEDDPYLLTREFFSTQEYTRQLAGKLGRSKKTIRAILEFVVKNPGLSKDEKIRRLVPKVNMVAAYRLLPPLDAEELQLILRILAKEL